MSSVNIKFFETRSRCPVCGDPSRDEFFASPMASGSVRCFIESHYRAQGNVDWRLLEGTDFALCECPSCELIYQLHVPKSSVLNALYNQMIDPIFLKKLEEERLTIANFQSIAGELSVLFEITNKHPGEVNFLDYGFGHGRWSRVARAMGAKVFAVETGDAKREYGRSIGVEVIED